MAVARAQPQHMVDEIELDGESRGPVAAIGGVPSPRAVTYRVTCQEWLSHGVSASRTLPTICVHSCSVSQVSFHAANGSSGQRAASDGGGMMGLRTGSEPT